MADLKIWPPVDHYLTLKMMSSMIIIMIFIELVIFKVKVLGLRKRPLALGENHLKLSFFFDTVSLFRSN